MSGRDPRRFETGPALRAGRFPRFGNLFRHAGPRRAALAPAWAALRAALILLLVVQGAALRAAPVPGPGSGSGPGPATQAASGLTVTLCSGRVISLAEAGMRPPAPPAAHHDCLSCCLATLAPPPAAQTPPARLGESRRLRHAAAAEIRAGRTPCTPCARDPPGRA